MSNGKIAKEKCRNLVEAVEKCRKEKCRIAKASSGKMSKRQMSKERNVERREERGMMSIADINAKMFINMSICSLVSQEKQRNEECERVFQFNFTAVGVLRLIKNDYMLFISIERKSTIIIGSFLCSITEGKTITCSESIRVQIEQNNDHHQILDMLDDLMLSEDSHKFKTGQNSLHSATDR